MYITKLVSCSCFSFTQTINFFLQPASQAAPARDFRGKGHLPQEQINDALISGLLGARSYIQGYRHGCSSAKIGTPVTVLLTHALPPDCPKNCLSLTLTNLPFFVFSITLQCSAIPFLPE